MIGKKRPFFAIFLLLSCLSLSSAWAWAQSGGGSGGGGSSGGGGQSGGTTGGRQGSSSQTDRQRPLFLSGKVLLDDGQEPGTRTQVELVCQGSVVLQEYTSGSGTFSIEIVGGGQVNTRPADASVASADYSRDLSGGFGGSSSGNTGFASAGGLSSSGRSVDLSNCELQAKLPGYQSDVIALGRRRVLDNPDIGVIILHNLKAPEGGTVSVRTLAAPNDARKAWEEAGKELQKEKPNVSKVTKELEKAVKIYPEFASAWFMLGEVHLNQNDRAAASEAFEKAKTADPDYINPYLSLAMMALEEQRAQEAADLSTQALKLNPQFSKAHYVNALANGSLGKMDAAKKSALAVVNNNQARTYPLVYYVLGFADSQQGNIPSAAVRYRSFLEIVPDSSLAERLREQLALWQEQGLIR